VSEKNVEAVRLVVAALWVGAGVFGVYTFYRHRDYIAGLPPDPDNDIMKRKFKRKLFWSFCYLLIGVWWALSNWFPILNINRLLR
jgi:hypothetical protein